MSRWWACAVAGLVAGAAPSIVHAQTFELFGPDSSRSRHESTQNFLIELRGGPWYPDVDAEFNGRATPFADMFGSSNRLQLGAELDWQFLRITPIGSLGIGVGAGYTSASAIAPLTQNPMPAAASWQRPSGGQQTSLQVIPGYAVAVVRIDVLARAHGDPARAVPQIRGRVCLLVDHQRRHPLPALALAVARRDGGRLGPRRRPPPAAPWARTSPAGSDAAARRLRARRRSAPGTSRWASTTATSFAEYVRSDLSGLGARPQLRLGTETWNVGLAMEF